MNFFALLKESEALIVKRIHLEQNLQNELTTRFETYKNKLLNELTVIPYAPNYKTEDSECMVINDFKEFIPEDILDIPTKIDNIDPVSQNDIEKGKIFAVVAFDTGTSNNTQFYFQVFDNRKVLKENSRYLWIWFKKEMFTQETYSGVKIDSKIDAFFDGDKLYFKSEHQLRRLIPLKEFYHEATNPEIDDFLSNSLWDTSISLAANSSFFNTTIRRKIHAITHSNILENHTVEQIKEVAEGIGLNLEIKNLSGQQQLMIPNNKKDFDDFIACLHQDYLQSLFNEKEIFRVSSKRTHNS